MNRSGWYTFLIPVLVLGCSRHDQATSHGVAVRDSAGIEIVSNTIPGQPDLCRVDSEPWLRIGGPASGQNAQLYRVFDSALLSDSTVAVVNRGTSEVRFYDRYGKLERTFGRQGGGPGEFHSLFRVWVRPGDTLIAGDYSPWRFTVIGPTGEYVRTVTPEPRYLTAHFTGVFNDGGFMLANECCSPASFAYEPRRLTILRHEPNGRLADTLGVFPTSRMARRGLRTARAIGTPLFEPRTIVAAQNSNILVGDSRVMELKVIDGSGRLVRIIRWSGEQQQVTERDVEAYRRNLMAQARTGLDSSFVRMDTDPEIPVNSSFPAYQAIVISRALGVWVQQYGKPTDLRHQRWMVFDSVGRFGCNVELPPPFEVHEVGDSYVLGVEKDSLDVEEVRAYRIYSPQ